VRRIVAICLLVSVRALEIFLSLAAMLLLCAMPARGALLTGNTYSISLVDINGNKLSTADGRVTIVVLTTSADREQARTVGDHVPDFCLGNPAYRMITVIHFTGRHMALGRRMATAFTGTACVKRQNGFRRGMTRRKSHATPGATYLS